MDSSVVLLIKRGMMVALRHCSSATGFIRSRVNGIQNIFLEWGTREPNLLDLLLALFPVANFTCRHDDGEAFVLSSLFSH